MYLPRLPSIGNSDVYINGDVSIDPSAAIAPGVILQADSDSRIIIAAGVCIGMGAILHAHKGTLEVEAGAVLGAGVLMVGVGKIGENACIGSTTTIWNRSVESWQLVPAGSLLGDTGRKITEVATTTTDQPLPVTEESKAVADESMPVIEESKTVTEDTKEINAQSPPAAQQPESAPNPEPTSTEETPQQQQPESSLPAAGITVYGQAHLNRLLLTLFPHKAVNPPPENGQS